VAFVSFSSAFDQNLARFIYQLQTFTSTSISLLASMPFGIMINVMLS